MIEFEINYVQQQKNGINFSLLTQLCLFIDIRPCFHGQAYSKNKTDKFLSTEHMF